MRKVVIALLCLLMVCMLGMSVYVFYYYPNHVAPQQQYEDAVKLYESGEYIHAAAQFETMLGYADSAEYADRSWVSAGDASFALGAELFASGDTKSAADAYVKARAYYKNGKADTAVFSAIDDTFYSLGEAAYSEGDNLAAEMYFGCIEGDGYSDGMDAIRLNYARGFMEQYDYVSAEQVLQYCSPSAKEDVSILWMDCGSAALEDWDMENAEQCFAKALAYAPDAEAAGGNVNSMWIAAGERAVELGDYALAEQCYGNSSEDFEDIIKQSRYEEALREFGAKNYIIALAAFRELGDYRDASEYVAQIDRLHSRMLVAGGSIFYATLEYDGSVNIHGDWEIYTAPDWTGIESLAIGRYRFMLGLRSDGTVVGNGNGTWGNLEVSSWRNIVQVACGDRHSVGLRADGTVVAAGSNMYLQRDGVALWSDITQVGAGVGFTVGLKADGTVVACGDNAFGQCNVMFMNDIAQIAVGGSHTVALKSDGTVVACGNNANGQCNVGEWEDIVAVYAGLTHTVGLKADGTLVACGSNTYGERDVSGYTDVLCASAGGGFTLIMLKDGTIIRLGSINNVD